MIRPLGSLPRSPGRALVADCDSGFRAVSVGSHHPVALLSQTAIQASEPFPLVHITPWSPSISCRLAAIVLAKPFPASGGDRPLVVFAPAREQGEDDARQLVGQGDRGELELVFDRLARKQLIGPAAQGVMMTLAVNQRRTGAHHQELAQIAVAHLGDAA